MSNCKQCNKPIESHTGRRPKLYCNDDCRDLWYAEQRKGKDKKTVHISTYNILVEENKALKLRIKELISPNPVMERNNPLENAARGRDEDGGNKDEVRKPKKKRTSKKSVPFNPATKESFDGSTKEALIDEPPNWPAPHPLWEKGDPKEDSIAFFNKYGCSTYEELSKLK